MIRNINLKNNVAYLPQMSYVVDPSQVCREIYEIRESNKSNSVADQDLPRVGILPGKWCTNILFGKSFAENCMKMKGGGR